jgi:peptide/nickel transport system substrate-binding protein
VQYYDYGLKIERDVEKAKALLKAAGHENLTVTWNTSNSIVGQLEAATVFKQQAQEAGITINLKNWPASDYWTSTAGYLTRAAGQEAITTTGGSMTLAWMAFLYSKAPYYGDTNWSTPEIDKQILSAVAETDTAKAATKWQDLQQLNAEHGGYIVWGNNNFVDGASKRVRGVTASKTGYFGGLHFDNVWLAD